MKIKFRVVYNNKIIGYERLNKEGFWEWMCLELNPDNWERWCKGVYPYDDNNIIIRNPYVNVNDEEGNETYEFDIINVTNKGIYNGNKIVVWDDILNCFVAVWEEEWKNWKNSQCGITYLKVTQGLHFKIIGNLNNKI